VFWIALPKKRRRISIEEWDAASYEPSQQLRHGRSNSSITRSYTLPNPPLLSHSTAEHLIGPKCIQSEPDDSDGASMKSDLSQHQVELMLSQECPELDATNQLTYNDDETRYEGFVFDRAFEWSPHHTPQPTFSIEEPASDLIPHITGSASMVDSGLVQRMEPNDHRPMEDEAELRVKSEPAHISRLHQILTFGASCWTVPRNQVPR
jgi:hypothetical protein